MDDPTGIVRTALGTVADHFATARERGDHRRHHDGETDDFPSIPGVELAGRPRDRFADAEIAARPEAGDRDPGGTDRNALAPQSGSPPGNWRPATDSWPRPAAHSPTGPVSIPARGESASRAAEPPRWSSPPRPLTCGVTTDADLKRWIYFRLT
ncbi:hypothetical protein BRD17_06800 [Halobacteriales archaeon SW_7_68_16]|nr:MAG: hypothetical protein BRD17_06800 [Halobacteriales archaeon SW_7_68_16]